jgi:NADH-quinone oxidoreductase subunit M
MLLTLVILLPVLGALALLAIPSEQTETIRRVGLVVALIVFVLSTGLFVNFESGTSKYQFEIDAPWISIPEIHFHIGIDGISLWLIMLTTFLMPIALLASWRITERVKAFFALFLLLETGMLGVFASLDLFLFYVFWEVSLVPMYFIIGVWGHGRRIYAAVKFFLFTMAGSALMLVAIVWLYRVAHTFSIPLLMDRRALFAGPEQGFLFLAFFVAFAIKVPMFPLHTWLPDAHTEAPTAGSVMLAAVMLKMGTYGMVRFCVPLFPEAAGRHAPWIVTLALIGIVYGALVAMVQPNLKKLVAYSSVSHLGLVVLGIFSFNQIAMDGAVFQMLNHGISTGALFLLVGMLYDRRHNFMIAEYGGLATPLPVFSSMFLFVTLSSIGLPLLNGFVGEFLILLGASQARFVYSVVAATATILSAVYMLWMYQRVFLGEVTNSQNSKLSDMSAREKWVILPVMAMALIMGVASGWFFKPMEASTAEVVKQSGVPAHVENRIAPPARGALNGGGQ